MNQKLFYDIMELQHNKYIIYADWIKTYIANEHWEFCLSLSKLGWQLQSLSTIDIQKYNKGKNLILCVTYDEYDLTELKAINSNNIVIYRLDDIFPYKIPRHQCIRNSDYICGPYMYLKIDSVYTGFDTKKSIWIPYSVPNINLPKEKIINNDPFKKVLVSGHVSREYPFRMKMVKASIKSDSIDYLEHCGGYLDNKDQKHNIIKGEFIKYLSKYLICFTDSLLYQYTLLKVFEIGLSGSLLLVCDAIAKPLHALGFIDGINCVLCNPNTILDIIAWCLDKENREKVDSIRFAGQKLVYEKHLTSYRAELLNYEIGERLKK